MALSKFLLFSVACVAQAYDSRVGPLLVKTFSSAIEIHKDGQRWIISLTKLPVHRVDCETPCGDLEGCYKPCIWGGFVFAFDEVRQVVYFATPTGTGQNKPLIIFAYRLRTRTVTRLTNEYGAGIGMGAVSPSGRYLAYVFGPHVAVVCAPRSLIGIVDLQERRSARTGSLGTSTEDNVEVTSLKWTSRSSLAYEADVVTNQPCNTEYTPTPKTGSVEITDLHFQ